MSHASGLPFPIPFIPTSRPPHQLDIRVIGVPWANIGYLAGNTHTVNNTPHISHSHSLTLLETKVDFCVHSELLLAYNWKQVSGHTSFNLQRSSRLEYPHWQTLLC